jgi:hypothetical protein
VLIGSWRSDWTSPYCWSRGVTATIRPTGAKLPLPRRIPTPPGDFASHSGGGRRRRLADHPLCIARPAPLRTRPHFGCCEMTNYLVPVEPHSSYSNAGDSRCETVAPALRSEFRSPFLNRLQPPVNRKADSQNDSQHPGQQRTSPDVLGISRLVIERQRTLVYGSGPRASGLQNRLRALLRRPGWVRFPSIPASFRLAARPPLAELVQRN